MSLSETAKSEYLLVLCTAIILFLAPPPSSAANHAVVLQYHHFGEDTPPSTSVSIKQFKGHLEYLNRNGFNVLPLEQVVSTLREGGELPDNCVAITIDDAYTSIYERGFPLLKEYGYPFTVFVNTEGIVKGVKSYMTWEQMRLMKQAGASFASHSHTHGYLIRRKPGEDYEGWRKRVVKDIKTSREILEKELGSESLLFAYPYGEYNSALKGIIEELGLTGFGQHSGSLWAGSDFSAIPRFPMASHFAEMNDFITKVRSLPLPVISEEPDDPLLPAGSAMPVLNLKLDRGDYVAGSITCYASGQGRINSRWTDPDGLELKVFTDTPLPRGRSRYNCTAAHKKENRFYWYSHMWIRPY